MGACGSVSGGRTRSTWFGSGIVQSNDRKKRTPTRIITQRLCGKRTKSSCISRLISPIEHLRRLDADRCRAAEQLHRPQPRIRRARWRMVRAAPMLAFLVASCLDPSDVLFRPTFSAFNGDQDVRGPDFGCHILASTSRRRPVMLQRIRSGEVTLSPEGPASASIRATSCSNCLHSGVAFFRDAISGPSYRLPNDQNHRVAAREVDFKFDPAGNSGGFSRYWALSSPIMRSSNCTTSSD